MSRGHRGTDGREDRLFRRRRVDDGEPLRRRSCDREEAVPHALVEGEVERRLEPVDLGTGLARETDVRWQVEEDRQVGLEPTGGQALENPEVVCRDPSPVALVGDRAVREAAAQDDVATGQRGADDLGDELCPRGVEEEGVRSRIVGGVHVELKQQAPDPFADRRPARLTRGRDLEAAGKQCAPEPRSLVGLAGTFGPLEGDEPTGPGWRGARHGRSVADASGRSGVHPAARRARTNVRRSVTRMARRTGRLRSSRRMTPA